MAKRMFWQHWQAEVVRQRELHWGPLADNAAMRAAAAEHQPEDKLFTRAAWLCKAQGFVPSMQHYQRILSALLWLLAGLAILSGIGLATSITPQGRTSISLLDALLSLFLLNTLLILLWAISNALGQRSSGLGALLESLGKIILRQGKMLTVAQAHTSVSVHQKLWRPALAALTHGFWLLLLSATWVTLTLRFISYDYQFEWRSTLLSPANIESVIDALSILPYWLGIERPETPQSTAIWLLASLLLYAIFPRLILFIGAEILRRVRLAKLQVDWQLAGFDNLYEQLSRAHGQRDEPVPAAIQVLPKSFPNNVKHHAADPPTGPLSWCTLEWPQHPSSIQPFIEHAYWQAGGERNAQPQNHGDISSREQRQQLLLQQHQQPGKLLLLVNPALSPDRGSLRFIAELAQSALLAVYLQPGPRAKLWQEQLQEHLQMTVLDSKESLVIWLKAH